MNKRIFTDLDKATADQIAADYRADGWAVIEDQQDNGLWYVEATK